MTTQRTRYTHWDDVPTKYAAAVLGGKSHNQEIIAAGNTLSEAKQIALAEFGSMHCEVVVCTLVDGVYSGPSCYPGEQWSDEL